jgi:hypothetical protein
MAAMMAMQQQFAMATPLQSHQHHHNLQQSGRGVNRSCRRRNNRKSNRNSNGNPPLWGNNSSSNINISAPNLYHTNFPSHVCSNKPANYCWSHALRLLEKANASV